MCDDGTTDEATGLPSLFDIHEGIDANLRWGTAIVDLMTTGDQDDGSIKVAADAACNYLREAKRNVDLLHEWSALNGPRTDS